MLLVNNFIFKSMSPRLSVTFLNALSNNFVLQIDVKITWRMDKLHPCKGFIIYYWAFQD